MDKFSILWSSPINLKHEFGNFTCICVDNGSFIKWGAKISAKIEVKKSEFEVR